MVRSFTALGVSHVRLPGGGPARYYRLDGSETRIGLITPLSQHFCVTCNRLRLNVFF